MNFIPKAISSRFQKYYGGTGYVPSPFFAQAIAVNQLFGNNSAAAARAIVLDPSQHSVVASGIRLLSDTVSQVRFHIGDNDKHAAVRILNRPAHISKSELIYGIVEGLYANGNAYLIPEDTGSLRLVDWRNMEPPKREQMYYLETKPLDSTKVRWPMEQVVHIRFKRSLDGINGVGPLANSALGDMQTDIQAQGYTNTMLRNLGVPGIIATPDGSVLQDTNDLVEPEAADSVREQLETQVSGNQVGRPMALRGPWKFFEPKGVMSKVDLRALRWVPEERLLADMGVHPALLAIGTGSENSQQAATMEHIQEFFLANTVEPLVRKITEQLTQQLLPFYAKNGIGPDTEYEYDLSGLLMYAAMKRKVQRDCIEIANLALASEHISREEWRVIAGLD